MKRFWWEWMMLREKNGRTERNCYCKCSAICKFEIILATKVKERWNIEINLKNSSVNNQILVNNMEENISSMQSRSNSKQWIYEAHLVIVDLFYSVRIVQFLTLACTQHTCTAQTYIHNSKYSHTHTHEQRVSNPLHYVCLRREFNLWPTWWKELLLFMSILLNKCKWYASDEKTTTFQFPTSLWRQEVKIEINHLENLRPSYRMLCAAIFKFIYMT